MHKFNCRKCNADLENFNVVEFVAMRFCLMCGALIPKKQREGLSRKVCLDEIDDMIKGRLLDMLEQCEGQDINADDLAYKAWEKENIDGVVFYSNYEADRLALRHFRWVDGALKHAVSNFDADGSIVNMRLECIDKFLVVAFIEATEHFLYDQLDIDRNEGSLSKTRIARIKRLIKKTSYDGDF